MKSLPLLLFVSSMLLLSLTGCGGRLSELLSPSRQVNKLVIDTDLVYPFGITVYLDSVGRENVVMGNIAGGVISSKAGVNGIWPCTSGLRNPQFSEIYRYKFEDTIIDKTYIKSYHGFIERGTFFKKSNGEIDLYFVENRDGHILKIDESFRSDELTSSGDGILVPKGARPYDIKVTHMGGGGTVDDSSVDVIYSTYGNNQLVMRRASDGQLQVLADKLSENRSVELFRFAGDLYPSVVTQGVGAKKSSDPHTGWVSVVRNHGGYEFTEHRFDIRGAAYARLAALDSRRPDELFLIVSHGVRDEIQSSVDHGLSIYRYFADTNTISKVTEILMPYVYRFDIQDLNSDGILDIVIGGHDGSGVLTVLLSRSGPTPTYDTMPIDRGLVAINDVKFGRTKDGVATLYLVADNGNGCPRKLGGSRLVRYQFTMPVTLAGLQSTKF